MVLATQGAYAEDVRAHEREAAQLAAPGVPFFVPDRRLGLRRPVGRGLTQALEQALEQPLEHAHTAGGGPVQAAEQDDSAPACGPGGTGAGGGQVGGGACGVPGERS